MWAGAAAVAMTSGMFSGLLGGGGAIDVRGETVCPRPADVADALDRIMGARSDDAPPNVAVVFGGGATIRLRFQRTADGSTEERALPVGLSCAERATSAAVILAAWEARFDSTAGTPPVIARLPRLDETGDVTELAMGGGGGVLLSVTSLGAAAGFVADFALTRPGSPVGVSGSLFLVDSRLVTQTPGSVVWRRFGFATDARWRLTSEWLWIEGRGGLALTAIHAANLYADVYWLDAGVMTGIRAGLTTRPSLWIQASGAYWPRPVALFGRFGTGFVVADAPTLPHFELLVAMGVAFGRGR